LNFTLPGMDWGKWWVKELDSRVGWLEESSSIEAGTQIKVEARSLVVLRHKPVA